MMSVPTNLSELDIPKQLPRLILHLWRVVLAAGEHRLTARVANCAIDPVLGCGADISRSAQPALSVYTAFGREAASRRNARGRPQRWRRLRAPFHFIAASDFDRGD